MNLPERLSNAQTWTVVGPMGPALSADLSQFPILAVDGGAAFTVHMDAWTGDLDSHASPVDCEHQLVLNQAKDHSDLASALTILARTKAKQFHFWGFLGGRMDHELFNLGESLNFLNRRAGNELSFYNQEGRAILKLFGRGNFSLNYTGTFSLGAVLTPEVQLTGQCRYPIPDPTILTPLSSFGLSNIGEGTMHLKTSAPIFVIFPEIK